MKRLLTILMVLMLLFVNVGCGEKGRLQEDNDTNIQQETKDKEKNLYDPADDIKPIAVGTVTISISCVTLLNHLDVYEGDANAIPKGGEILPAVSVELYENDTAYTLLKRVCREKNIEVDGEWDADSAYITQIGSVSEFTAGPLSAWLFTVNGTIPDVDSQSHPLEDGDVQAIGAARRDPRRGEIPMCGASRRPVDRPTVREVVSNRTGQTTETAWAVPGNRGGPAMTFA